jgi:hypothetical protein
VTDSRQRGANEASKRGQDGKSAFVPSGKESRDGCLTHVLPNAELTGRRRYGAWPARRMIGNERRAGQVPCRWRSG